MALQMKLAGLPEPKREHRFHPIRMWRFDFCWPAYKVALEVEGMTFGRGRHTRGSGYAEDCRKYNAAACLGWVVIRITSTMMGTDRRPKREALEAIELGLRSRGWLPDAAKLRTPKAERTVRVAVKLPSR